MADVKVSAMPAASALADADLVMVAQGGVSSKATMAQVQTHAKTGLSGADLTNGTVTLAKQANLAANSFQGNNTGSAAVPLALTVAQSKTLLAIANTDVSGLGTLSTQSGTFSGTSSGTNTGDQAGANPSATAGTSAVNGSATTFMRSDGAPALNLTITPTWTGAHTWSLAEPRMLFSESGQGSDLKLWDFDLASKVFTLRTRTDADGAGVNAIAVTRGTTTAVSNISFGNATNNNTFTFLGTAAVTINGSLAVNSACQGNNFRVTGSTVPTTGIYLPGANRLGFATSTALKGEFDANGSLLISTAGQGLSIKEGSNAKMGLSVLVGGTVAVSTTAVTAASRIFLTSNVDGGTPGWLRVSAKSAGTSFTITSSSGTDTSSVAWLIVEAG